MQCLLLKKHLFISQHEVGEQCLDSCKNKSLITLYYWQRSMQWSYTDTVFHVSEQH